MHHTLPLGRHVRTACVGLVLTAGLACDSRGWKTCYPARGSVLFQGKPPVGAIVVLHPLDDPSPTAVRPRATVDDNGTVVFSSYERADGAPAGEYAVTVSLWTEPSPTSPEPRNLLPAKYASPATTDLRVRVESRATELPPIELVP
jgi:hypothetical protein